MSDSMAIAKVPSCGFGVEMETESGTHVCRVAAGWTVLEPTGPMIEIQHGTVVLRSLLTADEAREMSVVLGAAADRADAAGSRDRLVVTRTS